MPEKTVFWKINNNSFYIFVFDLKKKWNCLMKIEAFFFSIINLNLYLLRISKKLEKNSKKATTKSINR